MGLFDKIKKAIDDSGLVDATKEAVSNIKETIESFRQIIDGEADDVPEAAFFMVGSIKDAREKAKTL